MKFRAPGHLDRSYTCPDCVTKGPSRIGMTEPAPRVAYKFGCFELQPNERRLLAAGEAATVGPRAFDVLVALVERAGSLVTKEQLLDLVWPNLVVEENNLQVHVSALRKILGGEAISTVAGHGYYFTLKAERIEVKSSGSQSPRKHNLPLQL